MKEFLLNDIKAIGTTVGDLYFPQTKLLLPFDGTNGATTTSDLSNSNHSVTFNGSASISTAQSKFGGSSLYLNGSSQNASVPSSSDWDFGADDFTVECWFRIPNISGNKAIFAGATDYWMGTLVVGDKLGYYVSANGTSWGLIGYLGISAGAGTITLAADTWYHFAFVRNGNQWTGYLNGAQDYTASVAGTLVTRSEAKYIGRWGNALNDFTGYIDEFRVTKGIARYTSAFTPPATAYLTSAGDVNKQVLINSTADGVAIGTGGINQARIAKAWVNFNGTGTVAIRGSYNVSSITDNGTGDYTANLSTALSNTNGAAVAMTGYIDHTWGIPLFKDVSGSTPLTTTQFRVATVEPETSSVTYYDQEQVSILIFGN
jgi:hypothetical protein